MRAAIVGWTPTGRGEFRDRAEFAKFKFMNFRMPQGGDMEVKSSSVASHGDV